MNIENKNNALITGRLPEILLELLHEFKAEEFGSHQSKKAEYFDQVVSVLDLYSNQGKGVVELVLDHGYVRMDPAWIMGKGDLDVVNDARTSFMKESPSLSKKDIRLIDYLGREEHTAPFRGNVVKLEFYAPLMIARQFWKYIIGSQHQEEVQSDEIAKYQDSFTAWNESSRRYITEELNFYIPNNSQWRSAPIEGIKQGSGDVLNPLQEGRMLEKMMRKTVSDSVERYLKAIELGACIEQARLMLPAYSLYVRWHWTCSLQALTHMLNERLAKDAQKEIQLYAQAVKNITEHLFPNGMQKLLK